MGDGVISTDPEGLITRMNPQAEILTGWKEAEAKGKSFVDIFRLVDEQTRESLNVPVSAVIAAAGPTMLPKNAMLARKKGRPVPIEDVASPVYGPEGEVRGAVVVFRDATTRRESERYLSRFKFVMDNSGEEFYLISPIGVITYANAAAEKSLGYEEGGLVGAIIGDIDPNMKGGRYREFYEMLAESDPGPFETVHTTKEGRKLEKEVRFGRMDYFGESYACVIARDISERKRVERTSKDFYSMVTHDLRSPMTTLLGYLEIVETQKDDILDTDAREMLGIIKTSAVKVYNLVNDFLTLSKLEAGVQTLNLQPVSPVKLVEKLADEFGPRAGSERLLFETDVPDGLPYIRVDTMQLERAFGNLIENAINYTPEQGSVTVGAAESDGKVSLFVKDTGPGIDPEDREQIFSKYYRSRKTENVKGTGLGLAIVDSVAKAHGGSVELVSEPGKGSRFAIVLPVKSQNETPVGR